MIFEGSNVQMMPIRPAGKDYALNTILSLFLADIEDREVNQGRQGEAGEDTPQKGGGGHTHGREC